MKFAVRMLLRLGAALIPALAFAEDFAAVYVPSKGDGWNVRGGMGSWRSGLVGTMESSPSGFQFSRDVRGCGVIFTMESGKVTTLYDFSSHPYFRGCGVGAQLAAHNGSLYGITSKGGRRNAGTVFRLDDDGSHHVIHHFTAPGTYPLSPLVQGADGRLYGVTGGGGRDQRGTVYRIGKTGRFTTLHSFKPSDPLGEFPQNGLTMGPDGALYGTARYGNRGAGTIFRIGSDGRVTLVKALDEADGCWPSQLALGQDGWLYGSAFLCGAHRLGTLFRVHPDGAFERLHDFSGADGSGPLYSLVQSPDGTWYGVTVGSFENPTSVAFRTRFDGQGVTVVHTFGTAQMGIYPSGPLHYATDGSLYGTTSAGGNEKGFTGTGPGMVFRLSP
jgi:uncharacterized repeat protein (TIGR03803 family)